MDAAEPVRLEEHVVAARDADGGGGGGGGGGLTREEQGRGMRWLIAGNGLSTILVDTNFYGNFFMLFLAELKLDAGRIGSLLSLLSVCGVLSLALAPTVSRVGYRRSWLTYAWARLAFAGLLLGAPAVARHWGGGATFVLVTVSVVGFGCSRAVGDTAILAWSGALIPNDRRGRFNAVTLIVQQVCKLVTVLVLGGLVAERSGLRPYEQAIGGGLVVGVAACWCYARMPGGKPVGAAGGGEVGGTLRSSIPTVGSMWATVRRDGPFGLYLSGMVVVIVGQCMLVSFVPLFMRSVAGMPSSWVVWLDAAGMAGGLCTSYLWGRWADRFGSKPMMLLAGMAILSVPALNVLAEWRRAFGVAGAFAMGLSLAGWNITLVRFLYTNAMPADGAPSYTAVFNAVFGLSGAIGPFVAGQVLRVLAGPGAGLSPAAGYHALFLGGGLIVAGGVGVLAFTQANDDVSLWQLCRRATGGGLTAGGGEGRLPAEDFSPRRHGGTEKQGREELGGDEL
jgi:hypothetical protein